MSFKSNTYVPSDHNISIVGHKARELKNWSLNGGEIIKTLYVFVFLCRPLENPVTIHKQYRVKKTRTENSIVKISVHL